jgi:hypothetical protein
LGALAAFFTVKKSEDEPKVEDIIRATAGGSQVQASKSIAAVEEGEKAEKKTPATLTLCGRINDIEVILIENSMDPDNSQALVLSFSATADVNNVSLPHS